MMKKVLPPLIAKQPLKLAELPSTEIGTPQEIPKENPILLPAIPTTQPRTLPSIAVGKVPTPLRRIPLSKASAGPDVEKYFGTHNGITFAEAHLTPGKNYTRETIQDSVPFSASNEIATNVFKRLVNPQRIIIYQTDAVIGTLTLSFLDNPSVDLVVAYTEEGNREILQANISAYKYDKKGHVPKENFTHVPVMDAGSVLMINIRPSRQNVNVEDIRALMDKSRHCSLIGLLCSRTLNIEPVSGFSCEQLQIKSIPQLKLYICRPEIGKQGEKVLETPMEPSEEVKWSTGLREFLRKLLTPAFGKNTENLNKILTPDAMKIWEVAFTEKSYNKTLGKNYEILEAFGDKILDAVFYEYVMGRYPEMTEKDLSQLKKSYVSKKYQSELATKLGLLPWIRHLHSRINISIREDVFESFFGAFVKTCNQFIGRPSGYGYAYNFIVILFNKVTLQSREDPKTFVIQNFEKLPIKPFPLPIEIQTEEGWEIHIDPKAKEYLYSFGFELPDVLGFAVGHDKNVALPQAYEAARETMDEIGLTREWLNSEKQRREFNKPYLAPYYPAALSRAKSEGYVALKFSMPKGTVGEATSIVQLYGTDTSDSDVRLGSLSTHDVEEGKQILLQDYAEGR
jgi:dsRNA-specific ribonuclease